MLKGKVKKLFVNRGFGFIRVDSGNDVFLHIRNMKDTTQFEYLKEGDEIFFENIKETEKGKEALQIFFHKKEHRFRNPYNFVRLEPNLNYSGLYRQNPLSSNDKMISGYIDLKLAINSPLFISGEEQNDSTYPEHKIYDFFKVNGIKKIPSSSLRGMIRNVFETVTNSCMTNIEGQHLTRRMSAREAQKLIPARIEIKNGGFQARLLRGHVEESKNWHNLQSAAWINLYSQHITIKSIKDVKHGDECWAVIEKEPKLKDKGKIRFHYWKVSEIYPAKIDKEKIEFDEESCFITKGYFFKSNNNIESKHDERVFFEIANESKQLEVNPEVIAEYEKIAKDYISRHKDEIKERNKPYSKCNADQADKTHNAISQFILEKQIQLRNGDLVYLGVDDIHEPAKVKFIAPVSIARLLFTNSIMDLLKTDFPSLQSCDCFNETSDIEEIKLCPACRTFGWVRNKKASSINAFSAFGGKVYFGDGNIDEFETIDEITLPILDQPKPTTQSFYLLNKQGEATFEVDYDSNSSMIRGRKYYWHQKMLNSKEYSIQKKGNQNRTIKNVAKSGMITFQIRFYNLTKFELGALLYSCQLEEGWQHRLGFAKPLGFGSLQTESVKLYKKNDMYYFDLPICMELQTDEKVREEILVFHKKYKEIFGIAFSDTNTYADLKALMSQQLEVPVHYPRRTIELDENGKQFEWFVANKRYAKKSLPLAASSDEYDFEI